MRPSTIPGVGATFAAAVVRSPPRAWAAAFTRTARVRTASKPPAKESVSVALVLPEETAPMRSMETPGMAVTSAKLDFVTPAAKAVSSSATVTVAPFRLASVSAAGLVAEIDAP